MDRTFYFKPNKFKNSDQNNPKTNEFEAGVKIIK